MKNNNKKDAIGKLSLWYAEDDRKYVASGVVELGENAEKFRVFLYFNENKKHDRSPDYYGYVVEPMEERNTQRKTSRLFQHPNPKSDDSDEPNTIF